MVETFHPILDVKFLVEERINEHNEYVILLLPYYLEEMLYLKLIWSELNSSKSILENFNFTILFNFRVPERDIFHIFANLGAMVYTV